jgi:hypothetical protein
MNHSCARWLAISLCVLGGASAAVAGTPAASSGSQPRVNLLIAGQKTAAVRSTDTLETAHEEKLETVAERIRLREMEDAYFGAKAKYFGRRLQGVASGARTELAFPKTGAEFLATLVTASRQGPISNIIVFGHSGSTGLFMLEDRGFYKAVRDVAQKSPIVEGTEAEKETKLRALGARDLSDLAELVRRGEVAFARDAVIFFTGCSIAGTAQLEPKGMASRIAEISGAVVFGSVNVTDGSYKSDFPSSAWDNEYSIGTWVRYERGLPAQDLKLKVLDVLKQLNLGQPRERATSIKGR